MEGTERPKNEEDLLEWGILPEDVRIDTYRFNRQGMDVHSKSGVEIGIVSHGISVKCQSQNSQIKNRDECFNMLYTILKNYKLK